MKKILLILLIPVICIGQGVKFENTTFYQLLSKAKKENKIIFIDSYTDWCGPCKKMKQDVYTNEAVGAFYNTNFINASIDMENGEGLYLATDYSVNAYPGLLFIDGNGKLLHKVVNYINPEEFINVGKIALNPKTQSNTQIEKFNIGNREPDFLYDLAINSIKNYDKNASIYSRAYYKTQKNLLTLKVIDLMFKTVDEPLSEEFVFLQENEAQSQKLYGEKSISDKLDKVALKYAISLNKQNPPKPNITQNVVLAIEKLLMQYRPINAKELTNKLGMQLAKDVNNYQLYEKYALAYLEKNYKTKNSEFLNETAWYFFEHVENKEALEKALKWAIESVAQTSESYNNDTVANLYFKLGDKNNGRIYAEISKKLENKSGNNLSEISQTKLPDDPFGMLSSKELDILFEGLERQKVKEFKTIFNCFTLASMEVKALDKKVYKDLLISAEGNVEWDKKDTIINKTKGVEFTTFKFIKKPKQIFFDNNEKFCYYNKLVDATSRMEAVEELKAKKFTITTKKSGTATEERWEKQGVPYQVRIQYEEGNKGGSIALIELSFLKKNK